MKMQEKERLRSRKQKQESNPINKDRKQEPINYLYLRNRKSNRFTCLNDVIIDYLLDKSIFHIHPDNILPKRCQKCSNEDKCRNRINNIRKMIIELEEPNPANLLVKGSNDYYSPHKNVDYHSPVQITDEVSLTEQKLKKSKAIQRHYDYPLDYPLPYGSKKSIDITGIVDLQQVIKTFKKDFNLKKSRKKNLAKYQEAESISLSGNISKSKKQVKKQKKKKDLEKYRNAPSLSI